MEIDIKVSGLEPLAAAIREAADIQYRAAKLRTDALAITTKSFFDALQIVLPAIISGSSMARAKDETDGGSALETSSTSDAPMAPNAVTPAGSAEDQGEPANPVKVAVENTSIEDAPVKNPGTARDSREARRVVEPDAAKEPPIEKTPAAEAEKEPQEQGGAATPETSMKLEDFVNDTLAYCMSYLDELHGLPNFNKLDFVNAVCAVCGCKNPGEMQGSIEDVEKLRKAVAAVAEKFKKDGVYA